MHGIPPAGTCPVGLPSAQIMQSLERQASPGGFTSASTAERVCASFNLTSAASAGYLYGGFLKWGYTSKSSILDWDFPLF